jgi:hypothetical protein
MNDLAPDTRVRGNQALYRAYGRVAAQRRAVGGSLDGCDDRAVSSRTGRECSRKSDCEPSIASHFE